MKLIDNIFGADHKKDNRTLMELRADRVKYKEDVYRERISEMSRLEDCIKAKLVQLSEFIDDQDEGMRVYKYLVEKSLQEIGQYAIYYMTDGEYDSLYDYYDKICEELGETLNECGQVKLAGSFDYAEATIDELIDGMANDAAEYNMGKKKEKIGGGIAGSSSLGAFDAVRRKNSNGSGT